MIDPGQMQQIRSIFQQQAQQRSFNPLVIGRPEWGKLSSAPRSTRQDLLIEAGAGLNIVSGADAVDLAANAHFQNNAWNRYDTTQAGAVLQFLPTGVLTVFSGPAGANPLTLSSVQIWPMTSYTLVGSASSAPGGVNLWSDCSGTVTIPAGTYWVALDFNYINNSANNGAFEGALALSTSTSAGGGIVANTFEPNVPAGLSAVASSTIVATLAAGTYKLQFFNGSSTTTPTVTARASLLRIG